MFPLIAPFVLGLYCFSKEISASLLGQPVLHGPTEALQGTIEYFHCEVWPMPNDEHILFQLFREGDHSKVLGQYTSLDRQGAKFPMIMRLSYEGYLECVASVQNNSLIQPTVSNKHHLLVVEPVEGAEVFVQSGETEFFEGRPLRLMCNITAGNHVSYHWLLNGRTIPKSPRYYESEELFYIYRTNAEDSGAYSCVAYNQFNKTLLSSINSTEVLITVKEVVSDPEISFTVWKETSELYFAVVVCNSSRGTPPITFSLYINVSDMVANATVGENSAHFILPVDLNRHMGLLHCEADNGDRTAYSLLIPFEVVTVGGPVTMYHDYNIGENYAVVSLMFFCEVEKGTFPQYQWFLNRTLLEGQGTFYRVDHYPPVMSILIINVEDASAGTYHCEASDNFDDTNVIRSKKLYIDNEVLNRLPVSVVAVVFGCSIFLVVLVTGCCCYGVVYRRRHFGEKTLWGLEMESMVAASEDKLDLEEYEEDVNVVEMARMDESDQGSAESTDEWPQIEGALKLQWSLEEVDEPTEES